MHKSEKKRNYFPFTFPHSPYWHSIKYFFFSCIQKKKNKRKTWWNIRISQVSWATQRHTHTRHTWSILESKECVCLLFKCFSRIGNCSRKENYYFSFGSVKKRGKLSKCANWIEELSSTFLLCVFVVNGRIYIPIHFSSPPKRNSIPMGQYKLIP